MGPEAAPHSAQIKGHSSSELDTPLVCQPSKADAHEMLTIQQGVPLLKGAAIERALVLRPLSSHSKSEKVTVAESAVPVQAELVGKAVERLRDYYAQLAISVSPDALETAKIFRFASEVLKERTLVENINKLIQVHRYSASDAVEVYFDSLMLKLQNSGGVFAERVPDVRQVQRGLLRVLKGENPDELSNVVVPDNAIIIARELEPAQLLGIARKGKVAGVVIATGTKTSHVVIMAKEFGVPLIAGIDLTAQVNTGDVVAMDAYAGEVNVHPTALRIAELTELIRARSVQGKGFTVAEHEPRTRDGVRINLQGTLGEIDRLSNLVVVGAEGVGLYRTEHLFMGNAGCVPEDVQFRVYRTVIEAMKGKPVRFRTFDLGSDKLDPEMDLPPEKNPMLGQRGIRLCFVKLIDDFRTQLRAMIRAAALGGSVEIMFPMVNDASEFLEAKALLVEQGQRLIQEGVIPEMPNIRVGAMVETPAAALCAPTIFAVADFGSIGSNDLTQYVLAVDREASVNTRHSPDPHHPAVIRIMKMIVRAARRSGKPLSICGDMAGDPTYTPLLIGLGLRDLSMMAVDLPKVNFALSCLNTEDCRKLANEMMSMRNAPESLELLNEHLSQVTDRMESERQKVAHAP